MDNQEEKPYIKEKIVKKKSRPVKYLIRALECIVFAAIFGAVAAVVFFMVKPYVDKEDVEETSKTVVELPTYTQSTTEESTLEVTQTEESTSEVISTEIDPNIPTETVFNDQQESWIDNKVNSVVESAEIGLNDISKEDELLMSVARSSRESLVKVRGYLGENIAWETQAIIIYHITDAGEVLLLAEGTIFNEHDRITVVMPAAANKELQAELKGVDHVYGLAILSVSTADFTEAEKSRIKVIELGNNYVLYPCDRVLLIGAPYLNDDSIGVGRISTVKTDCSAIDSSYRLFGTDISVPAGSRGFAINLSGQLIGIINNSMRVDYPAGFAAIIGTGDISDTLHVMCNGGTSSYMGIVGVTVTKSLQDSGMPAGVYVTEVQPDSPAYDAGISAGDIISAISLSEITDINMFSQELTGNHLPGETVIVTVYREGRDGYKSMTVNVKLGSR